MKRLQLTLLASLAATLSLAAVAADDFYVVRLRLGQEAARRGQNVEAAEELRIACFGLLEQPALLVEGLAWLGVAQSKAGRTADVDATLLRFAEVERKFAAFQAADVEPGTRKEFVALAKSRLSPEVFRLLPGLNPPPPTPVPPPPPQASPSATREELKAALEKNVLGKDWKKAAGIAAKLEPFGVGEEVSSFYAAVSAWEAGDHAKAKALAKPAVGKVTKSAFVDYYFRKILEAP